MVNQVPIFESLEIVITLRCNAACRNCIRLCNSTLTTGLDYSDMDMNLADVARIRDDIVGIESRTGRQAFGIVCLTGGEPFMHPDLAKMVELLRPLSRCWGDLVINSNRTLPIPDELEPYVVHWWGVDEKPRQHQCMLVSPSDPPLGYPRQGGRTWEQCQHYRKHRLVATLHGYQLCCAAEGYTRLLHLPELLVGRLPDSEGGMPRPDQVCQHCAFGAPVALLERDYGRPVSPVFDAAALLNRHGRTLPKKLRGNDGVVGSGE